MKKHLPFLAIFAAFTLTLSSCGKDDSNDSKTPAMPANSFSFNGTAKTDLTVACQPSNDYYYQIGTFTGGTVTFMFKGTTPPAPGTYKINTTGLIGNNQVFVSTITNPGGQLIGKSTADEVIVTTVNNKVVTNFTDINLYAAGGDGSTAAKITGTLSCQ